MKANNVEDASSNEQIDNLEAEIENLKAQIDECAQKTRDLLSQEDPYTGITYAQEIFKLKQEKLALQVEIDIRKKKINRLKFI
jgi:hypothetical protein